LIHWTCFSELNVITVCANSIGLAIAERLGREGASVVISSRKQKHVDSALQHLKHQGLSVEGMVCHVGKKEDRQHLLQKVCVNLLIAAVLILLCSVSCA